MSLESDPQLHRGFTKSDSQLYQGITDRARKVLKLAKEEAVRLNHVNIDTEHILLGLVKEGSGVAMAALKGLGVDFNEIRKQVVQISPPGTLAATNNDRPQSLRFRQVLQKAAQASAALDHKFLGTGHLLLGLLQVTGVAKKVLTALSVTEVDFENEVLALLGTTHRPLVMDEALQLLHFHLLAAHDVLGSITKGECGTEDFGARNSQSLAEFNAAMAAMLMETRRMKNEMTT